MASRRSSVFDLNELAHIRKEKDVSEELIGKCIISHSDSPSNVSSNFVDFSLFDRQLTTNLKPNKTQQQKKFSIDGITPSLERRFSKSHRKSTYNDDILHQIDERRVSMTSRRTVEQDIMTNNVKNDQNNYELAPKMLIDTAKVENIITEEFEKLKHFKGRDEKSTCCELSNKIKSSVKLLGYTRFKYVVTVTMGDQKNQGLRMTSTFFWDQEYDTYVSKSFQEDDKFYVVVVYALYCL